MYAMSIPYMDLEQIYKSNQTKNIKRIDNGIFVFHHRDKAVKVQQKKESFLFSCTEEDFYNVWWEYFDLQTDYSLLNNMFKILGPDFKIKCNRCKGLRILKQDVFELIIKVLVKNKQQIYSIQRLGKVYKKSVINSGMFVFYDVPTPEIILKKVEENKNTKRLLDFCKLLVDGGFSIDYLKGLDYNNAGWYLIKSRIFTKDEVRTICLFGLHQLQGFPQNKITDRMFKEDFGMSYDEWREWYHLDKKQKLNLGYLRQVLMYNFNNPIKESEIEIVNKKKRKKL